MTRIRIPTFAFLLFFFFLTYFLATTLFPDEHCQRSELPCSSSLGCNLYIFAWSRLLISINIIHSWRTQNRNPFPKHPRCALIVGANIWRAFTVVAGANRCVGQRQKKKIIYSGEGGWGGMLLNFKSSSFNISYSFVKKSNLLFIAVMILSCIVYPHIAPESQLQSR